MAALIPSWLSLIARLTLRQPRWFRLRRNSVQNGFASPLWLRCWRTLVA